MKMTHVKITRLALGFILFMHLSIRSLSLHDANQGGEANQGGLHVLDQNQVFLTGRKHLAVKPVEFTKKSHKKSEEHSKSSKTTDAEGKADYLVTSDYLSRMRPRRKPPIHN